MAETSDLVELHARAVEIFAARVRAVGDDQWQLPTPCSEWNVRDLVNHLVNENKWTPPLLGGQTVEEVGDRFDGDLLDADPKGRWEEAAAEALAAASEPGALNQTVHVSFGDISGEEYLTQLTTDHLIHAWDLARAIGGDERLDPELVVFARRYLDASAEQWRTAGVFGPAAHVGPDADEQVQLLAMAGRQA